MGSGIFLNADRTEILPMAMWTCNLVANECSDNAAICNALTMNRRMLRGKKDKNKKSSKSSKKGKNGKNGKKGKSNGNERDCKAIVNGQSLSTWCPSACGMCGDDN